MKPVMFILFVDNQEKSRDFYEKILESSPILDIPGMTEFKLNENTLLGLMPRINIKRLLGEEHFNGANEKCSPCCEIYFPVDDIEYKLHLLRKANGTIISNPQIRSWGDIVAYGKDPDGNIIAFAKSSR